MQKKVAYQGIKGSFSSMAARAMLGNDIIPIHTTRFRDVFEHLKCGRADIGVVPIENALAGSIHEVFDLLSAYDCTITKEYHCPVQLHLLTGSQTTPLGSIKQAISHPKALEQCSIFLERNPHITPIVFSDTAGAAAHVRELGDASVAAIASEEAALEYGLGVAVKSIQNHATNITRFFAVAREPDLSQAPTKCSVLITLRHEPGSLYHLLGEFVQLGLNVTKIESRPIAGKPFQYAFHLDLDGDDATARVNAKTQQIAAEITPYELLKQAVTRAQKMALECRCLGFY